MAASKHRADRQPAGTNSLTEPDAGPVEALLARGMGLRLRAPEIALVFGERAAALAESAGSDQLWVRAEALAVFAQVRLGQRAGVVDRAMAALRAAEAGGYAELTALLRADLALCARSIGVPLAGFTALQPVLATRTIAPAERAFALVQLVGCMATLGRRAVLDRALREAEELVEADATLDADGRRLLYAAVCSRSAAHLRRHGDISASMDSARRGLRTLDDLTDSSVDGGQVGTRLALELVCALLDTGDKDEALSLARPLFDLPPRAAAVSPLAWLRLAVATRIYLPSGAGEAAGALVREALYFARRHQLHALTARLLHELAHVEEQLQRPAEAIQCLHGARMAEHSEARTRRQACALLTGEFGRAEHSDVAMESLLSAAPSAHGKAQRQSVAQDVPAERSHAAAETVGVASAQEATAHGAAVSAMQIPPERPHRSDVSAAEASRQDRDASSSARDVLARLGVSVSGGGRRRAADADTGAESGAGAGADHAADQSADTGAESRTEVSPDPGAGEATGADPELHRAGATDGDSDHSTVSNQVPADRNTSQYTQPDFNDMDSLLDVFSNWTNGPADDQVDARSRARHHSDEGAMPLRSSSEAARPQWAGANGRHLGEHLGERGAGGRHRGEE